MSDRKVFAELNAVNVGEKVEKKGGLSYLPWAWAWAEAMKRFPDMTAKVYENAEGWNYHTDGSTCWVKAGVTIEGIEHIEYLPVMDFKNRSIPVTEVTSMDVIKAIQRCVTKCIARHGLGLYIYSGEDLPDPEREAMEQAKNEQITAIMAGTIRKEMDRLGVNVEAVCQRFGVPDVESLTNEQFMKLSKMLNAEAKKRGK